MRLSVTGEQLGPIWESGAYVPASDVSAVKRGMTYDHSMGFTPLEGAVMGTPFRGC